MSMQGQDTEQHESHEGPPPLTPGLQDLRGSLRQGDAERQYQAGSVVP